MKRVKIGDMTAALAGDGTIELECSNGVKMIGLTKSDVEDLLVALDAVQGEQPEPNKPDLRETIIGGAHALARDVYRLTSYRATVTVTVHPHVFHSLIDERSGISGDDYRRGRFVVARDVEIKLDQNPLD